MDDKTFTLRVLNECHVLVVHGSGFGQKPGTKHFRVVTLPTCRRSRPPTTSSRPS